MAQPEQLVRKKAGHQAQMTKLYGELEKAMMSRETELVRELYGKLCGQFDSFKLAHLSVIATINDPAKLAEIEESYDFSCKNFEETSIHVNEFLTKDQFAQSETMSQMSSQSAERLREAKIKKAKAMFKAKQLSQMQELNKREQEVAQAKQTFEVNSEIAEAELEEALYQEIVNEEMGLSPVVDETEPKPVTRPAVYETVTAPNRTAIPGHQPVHIEANRATAFAFDEMATQATRTATVNGPNRGLPTANTNSSITVTRRPMEAGPERQTQAGSENTENNSLETLIRALKGGFDLPKPELSNFSGNPVDYCKFISNFVTNIETKVSDPNLRLTYLIQYTSGEAKRAIEDCVLLGSEGYEKAKGILAQRYGRPHVVARAYIEKLVNGGKLGTNDVHGLSELSLEMEKCQITLQQMGFLSDLHNTSNLRRIVGRLPVHIRSRWVDRADGIIESGREPNFNDLTMFITGRARIASSMYGIDMAGENKSQGVFPSGKGKQKGSKGTTYAAQGDNKSKSGEVVRRCKCCNGDCVNLASCAKFESLSLGDRRKLVRKLRLCDNCFRWKHFAKDCRLESACTVPGCTHKHNTLLHSWRSGSNDEQTSSVQSSIVNSTKSSSTKKVCMAILPVRLWGKNGCVDTYALLDNGSDVTLCNESLLEKLGITGKHLSYQITTVNQDSVTRNGTEVELTVSSIDGGSGVNLSRVWTVPTLSISLRGLPSDKDVESWPHLRGIKIPKVNASEVMLLIGSDCPEVLCPLEVRRGGPGEPCAIKSPLGWAIFGPMGHGNKSNNANVNFQQVKEEEIKMQLERLWTTDFNDTVDKPSMSVEDREALAVMEETITLDGGHYKLSLPWKNKNCCHLPSNRFLADNRLNLLRKRLQKDPDLQTKYSDVMEGYLRDGHAERVVPGGKENDRTWYLPHHPVLNPNKPGKVRVVFDCAAKYRGTSLNDHLLQGPDLTNSLIGVLIRFRQERCALAADIEGMFHQVKVQEEDRNSLRFLWWPEGDLQQDPEVYRMAVHIFGAKSSPSCAAFALRHTAAQNSTTFDPDVRTTVERNFYVDDCLKSVPTEDTAISLATDLQAMLRLGGFRLTKWVSNSRRVLDAIPESERAPSVRSLDCSASLPRDRALGVNWNVELDSLEFDVRLKNNRLTRRGVLSTVSSLFDPCGFVAPVTLPAKFILQDLCRRGLGWDDEVTGRAKEKWQMWLDKLPELRKVKIDRCYKPKDFGQVRVSELHLFSDASEQGYGASAYIRLVDEDGRVACALVLGKSRLAPIKQVSIPRLELSAAVVACRLSKIVTSELDIEIQRTVFWTDSTIVLGYIRNRSRRFKTFVANRLSTIHDCSTPSQWRHVPTALNPADVASRGIEADDKIKIDMWLNGPYYLKHDESAWPTDGGKAYEVNDAEVKEVAANAVETNANADFMTLMWNRCSNWTAIRKGIAWLLRYKQFCRSKYLKQTVEVPKGYLTVREFRKASDEIVRHVQMEAFMEEFTCLNKGRSVLKTSKLAALCPFVEDELIRVGGRLHRASKLPRDSKHQVILPRKHHITNLVILDCHRNTGHAGPKSILTELRRRYWIVSGLEAIKAITTTCLQCRRQNLAPMKQIMAPLPSQRLQADKPPFTYTAVDFFGPFPVKYRRGQVKRYGVLFTCLTMRAVHIEIAHTLDTNSFLGALSRFMSRRGRPESIFSDNGTNFTSGDRELKELLREFNQKKINEQLLQQEIQWHFRPPHASHMGGVYERLIRSARRILKALAKEQVLTDESLLTFMAEAEKILNDRPITQISSDYRDPEPLTPSMILIMRHNSSLPSGVFSKNDLYPVRWWKQVQYLANIFWRRWLKEYLPALQERAKWRRPHRNVKINDLVLLVDENLPRGQWPLGLVVRVNEGRDGYVRSCEVRSGSSTKVRPITKLCLLEQV